MAYSRGYHSYRGRTPRWRIAVIVLLVVVILVSVAVIAMSRNIVYDESGTPQLELPWREEPAEEPPQAPEPPLDLTIEEPVKERTLRGFCTPVPLTRETWSSSVRRAEESFDCNAIAVTLKDGTGNVYFNSTTALPGTVQFREEESDVALSAVVAYTQNIGGHTIARLSCFHDPKAANRDVEGMGLKNTGGYIFYDGNNSQWLDPAKPAARKYLCGLAKEAADLGFDEILLTDLGYPTVGKLNKIDYGEGERSAHLAAFLEEMRAALAPYGVMLSIEVPEAVIAQGSDEDAGLLLADIAPKVDRIYAPTAAGKVSALTQAVSDASQTTEFVPELAEADSAVNSFLIS